MLTQEVVTWLEEDYAPGVARSKLLDYLQRLQNEVYSHNCAATIFLNKDDPDFPIPFLTTTAEQLDYIPSESNLVDSDGNAISLAVNGYTVTIRQITKVFHEITTIENAYNSKRFLGRDFIWAGINPEYSRRAYPVQYRVDPAHLTPKTPLQDAQIIFTEDPDTTTAKYYVEFYMGAPELTSESIPMAIDTDRFFDGIATAVQGYIERSRLGHSEKLEGSKYSWRDYWVPQIRSWLNEGAEEYQPYEFQAREAG